jgi:hypothetical protein
MANVTEAIKHDRTQTTIAHDRLNRSSFNKYVHKADIHQRGFQVVHTKISALTFGTNFVSTSFAKELSTGRAAPLKLQAPLTTEDDRSIFMARMGLWLANLFCNYGVPQRLGEWATKYH